MSNSQFSVPALTELVEYVNSARINTSCRQTKLWICIIFIFYPSCCMALGVGQLPREMHTGLILSTNGVPRKLLGITWYYCVGKDDMRPTAKRPHLSAVDQAWHFSLFDHIAWMFDDTDAKILTAFPFENWRRPPGCPHTTWMKTI